MKPLRLVQITDTHLFGAAAGDLRGRVTLPAMHAVLDAAAADIAAADALLVTGDLVQDDPGGYAHFHAALRHLRKPVLCLPGNHDDTAQMRAALLRDGPFQVGGWRDLADWRLVLLDSTIPGQAGGRLAPAELDTLELALAGAGQRHVLVCLHHHPVPMASRWLDEVGLENPAALFGIVDRHSSVRGIVWGHVHQAYDSQRGAVRLLSSPSTCTQFRPGAEDFAVDTRPPGYRILELRADGAIDTEVVWLERFAAQQQQHDSASPSSPSSSVA